MSTVNERIAALREQMRRLGADGCLVTSGDDHLSEYAGPHFAARRYLSGFTGSAGTLVVLQNEAGLWTDGRYFLQAEDQLRGSGVTLYKMGEKGVPTLTEFLYDRLPEGGTLFTDGRLISVAQGKELNEKLRSKNVGLELRYDLPGMIWEDRPPMALSKAWILDVKYAGRCAADKLSSLRAEMDVLGAESHIITSLDDIEWLFNLRGNDVGTSPLLLSFAVVEENGATLFIDERKMPDEVRAYLSELGVSVEPYDGIYDYASACAGKKVLICESKVNYAIYSRLEAARAKIITAPNPTELMKAVKNKREIENIKRCHVKDGVAVVRFMRWLKENVGKIPMTEISAADKLEEFRMQNEGILGLSFGTICGYGPHGAIIHYGATEQSNVPIEPRGMLLVDSGGHYYEGTTDITRTFAVGEMTEEEKFHFALVLKSHLDLEYAVFPEGADGAFIDIIARRPVWEHRLDFKHGTGHGVGFLLNVHEGPQRIMWKQTGTAKLAPGMVTTDEPGIYIEGSHGIRTENELLCVYDSENEYGRFLKFEPVTYAPIDLDAVDVKYLNETDRAHLNDYHRLVYETLAPELTEDERQWLRHYTRAI